MTIGPALSSRSSSLNHALVNLLLNPSEVILKLTNKQACLLQWVCWSRCVRHGGHVSLVDARHLHLILTHIAHRQAKAEQLAAYRQRMIERAWASERDPTTPLQ